MNITVTLTADSALLKILSAFLSLAPASSTTTTTPATVEAKQETAQQEVPVKVEPAKEVSMPSVNGKTITAITIEQIRALVKQKADDGKRDHIKATLAEFGADKVTSLQKEQYTDFYTKLEAL